MGVNNRYVVLFWTHGLMPTPEQVEEARHFGPHVMFRNAAFHRKGDACEPCTAVAGEVPSDYGSKYPRAVSYVDWIAGKLPVVDQPPTPGQLAIGGMLGGSFASRVIPDGEHRPTRAERRAAAAAVDGDRPLDGMTGQDSPSILPPPPPAAGRSLTGEVFLPPPPPLE